jgi:DNA-binding transcriptional LysR family regulator
MGQRQWPACGNTRRDPRSYCRRRTPSHGSSSPTGFRSGSLAMPTVRVVSASVPLRNFLLATGRYISVLPRSMLHFGAEHLRVKILPVKLPGMSQPIEILTLKNRMPSPTANLFIEMRARDRKIGCRPAARR